MSNNEIMLGKLVDGQQLQAGIALAVAQGVWHWTFTGPPGHEVWMVDDIIRYLISNTKILISDANKILSLQGVRVGETSKVWVERGDYVQAVLLLAAQTIDVMRQVRAPE